MPIYLTRLQEQEGHELELNNFEPPVQPFFIKKKNLTSLGLGDRVTFLDFTVTIWFVNSRKL